MTSVVKNYEVGNLYFGQLNLESQLFFDKTYGQHTRIKLRDLPHYIFWRDREWKNPNNSLYYKYLESSWNYGRPTHNTRRAKFEKIHSYLDLMKSIDSTRIETPVDIVETPDGSRIIFNGNHRASIAYYLGMDLPVNIIKIDEYISKIIKMKNENYMKTNSIPAQSIFYYEQEIFKGLRNDTLERFKKIHINKDIRGKNILDVGAEFGAISILSWHFGAKSVEAVDYNPANATAALRLSTLLNSQLKYTTYKKGGVRVDQDSYDTVVAFSLYNNLTEDIKLYKNLIKKVKNVLYFEGQKHTTKKDYTDILSHFNKVELLSNINYVKLDTQPLFRCEK